MNAQSSRLCSNSIKAKSNSLNMTFSSFKVNCAPYFCFKQLQKTHKVLKNVLKQTNSL